MKEEPTIIEKVNIKFQLDKAIQTLLSQVTVEVPEELLGKKHPFEIIKLAHNLIREVFSTIVNAINDDDFRGEMAAHLIVSTDLNKMTTTEQLMQSAQEAVEKSSIIMH